MHTWISLLRSFCDGYICCENQLSKTQAAQPAFTQISKVAQTFAYSNRYDFAPTESVRQQETIPVQRYILYRRSSSKHSNKSSVGTHFPNTIIFMCASCYTFRFSLIMRSWGYSWIKDTSLLRTLSPIPTTQRIRDTSLYRTDSWVPVVPITEVPLYLKIPCTQWNWCSTTILNTTHHLYCTNNK